MGLKNSINNILRKGGVEINRYPNSDLRRRSKIISDLGIDLIFDVGANSGQYGQLVRELGYTGNIISFEPINSVFETLKINTANDNKWKAYNYALGASNHVAEINISKNAYSSSILEINENHVAAAPESAFLTKQKVEVKKLDDVYHALIQTFKKPFLKLDVQGFEKNVLDGGANVLHLMAGIQLELSLSPLYKNEIALTEMLVYMKSKGFELVSLENGFADPQSAFLLQVDGIFINRNSL